MSVITFLGDVSLLNESMICEYKINNEFVFNLEYVLTDNKSTPKKNKVNLCGNKINFTKFFNRKPLAVSLANNHIMDFGEIGFKDTVDYLNEIEVLKFGVGEVNNGYENPLILDVGSKKVGLMGYSLFNEKINEIGVDFFSREKAVLDIKKARDSNVDCIIVNIHWGIEDDPWYTNQQRNIGHFLIDSGVDLVIGHHPHCIQPFEKYNGKYIFYSLGNCIFPNIKVNCFYDKDNKPKRTYRKRQFPHNKTSYAVSFDLDKNEVIKIEKLKFSNGYLRKSADVDLNKEFRKPLLNNKIIMKLRKRTRFIYSNLFVDGKMFDFNALRHEIEMKKRRLK